MTAQNTFILRRKFPPKLYKGAKPPQLGGKWAVYEHVDDCNTIRKPNINIILTKYVKNMGYPGDVVSVRPNVGYWHFILPGIAVFDNAENRTKYGCDVAQQGKRRSPFVERTMEALATSRTDIEVIMNNLTPWVLDASHIRISMRKYGVFVLNESQIELPDGISGPDPANENKLFYATVTINGEAKVRVRCRLRQWCLDAKKRPRALPDYHLEEEYLFADDAAEAEKRKAAEAEAEENEQQ